MWKTLAVLKMVVYNGGYEKAYTVQKNGKKGDNGRGACGDFGGNFDRGDGGDKRRRFRPHLPKLRGGELHF